jgi:hypothetical protein
MYSASSWYEASERNLGFLEGTKGIILTQETWGPDFYFYTDNFQN